MAQMSFAQQPEIVADRPDPSAILIPKGSLQIESGMTWTTVNGVRTIDSTQTLLRIGLGKTEFRLGLPDYMFGMGKAVAVSGFGDLFVGIKRQIIASDGGFTLAVIPAFSCPTGSDARSTHTVDPQLQIPFSIELKHGWAVGGVMSGALPTQNGRRNLIGESLLYAERELGKRTEAFVAYVGDFPRRGAPGQLMEFGTAVRVRPRQRVDVFVGIGLSHAAPVAFVAVGYSFPLGPDIGKNLPIAVVGLRPQVVVCYHSNVSLNKRAKGILTVVPSSDLCNVPCFKEEVVKRVRAGMPDDDQLEEIRVMFAAIADRTRLKIFYALQGGEELCVCDVAHAVGISVSAASHHLRKLRDLKFLKYRNDGKMAYYSVKDRFTAKLVYNAVKRAVA